MFAAQCPTLARLAHDTAQPLDELLRGAAFGWLFIAPLFFYALAALTRIVARLMRGQGTWYRARIALFWAFLAAAPMWLLNGLVGGFIGPGPIMNGVGVLAIAVFLAFWMLGMVEVERNKAAAV